MDFEVKIDTGLQQEIIKLNISAESEKEAKNKAIQICYSKYKNQYSESNKEILKYKQIYRNLMRKNKK
jgi:hypothetical protein